MSPLDSKKTYKALKKKGFVEAENKSNDHKRLEFIFEGKVTRFRTMFSHNNEEINDWLISQMSRQIGLSKPDFVRFAQCTLSEAGYIKKLKDQAYI